MHRNLFFTRAAFKVCVPDKVVIKVFIINLDDSECGGLCLRLRPVIAMLFTLRITNPLFTAWQGMHESVLAKCCLSV